MPGNIERNRTVAVILEEIVEKAGRMMNVLRIRIEPVNFTTIIKCNISKALNEHITSSVEGYVTNEECEKALKAEYLSIYAILEDNSSRLLFNGIPMTNEIEYSGNTTLLKINGISTTVFLDEDPHFRTFQGQRQTYRNIVDEIIKHSRQTGIIFTAGKEDEPGRIVVQYNESDWRFFKRLAGELGTVLVADCNNTYPCFYFGLPERKKEKEITFHNMQIHQIKDKGTEVKQECTIVSREHLEHCDIVYLKKQNWRVIESLMEMDKGEILFKYKLEPVIYKRKPKENKNHRIKGLSVSGTVLAVKEASVQVRLHSELDQDWEKGFWFEFATIYTAPGGTGWYCMPEIGESIRLYFPDESENHAYVISGTHKDATDLQMDPDIKSFKTRYEKEMRFTPKEILLTNNRGMFISLHDDKGICIRSDGEIVLHSDTLVDIRSNSKVSIQSRDGVSLQQNRNILLVKDGIHEKGRNIDHI